MTLIKKVPRNWSPMKSINTRDSTDSISKVSLTQICRKESSTRRPRRLILNKRWKTTIFPISSVDWPIAEMTTWEDGSCCRRLAFSTTDFNHLKPTRCWDCSRRNARWTTTSSKKAMRFGKSTKTRSLSAKEVTWDTIHRLRLPASYSRRSRPRITLRYLSKILCPSFTLSRYGCTKVSPMFIFRTSKVLRSRNSEQSWCRNSFVLTNTCQRSFVIPDSQKCWSIFPITTPSISTSLKSPHPRTLIRSNSLTSTSTQDRASHLAWRVYSWHSRTTITWSISVDSNLVCSSKVSDCQWRMPWDSGNKNSVRS